jgi:hypothetical protein
VYSFIQPHRKPWLDSQNNQSTLDHCAELINQSVDANQFGLVSDKLTNLPAVSQFENEALDTGKVIILVTNTDVIHFYEKFVHQLTNALNQCIGYLTDKNINTYLGDGYEAVIPNPHKSGETNYFQFWSETGPVRSFSTVFRDERASVRLQFYQNGKLASFELYMPTPNTGSHKGDSLRALFKEDGQVYRLEASFNQSLGVHFDIDTAGNSNVRFTPRRNTHKL